MWQWHFFLTYLETGSLRIDEQSDSIPPPSLLGTPQETGSQSFSLAVTVHITCTHRRLIV